MKSENQSSRPRRRKRQSKVLSPLLQRAVEPGEVLSGEQGENQLSENLSENQPENLSENQPADLAAGSSLNSESSSKIHLSDAFGSAIAAVPDEIGADPAPDSEAEGQGSDAGEVLAAFVPQYFSEDDTREIFVDLFGAWAEFRGVAEWKLDARRSGRLASAFTAPINRMADRLVNLLPDLIAGNVREIEGAGGMVAAAAVAAGPGLIGEWRAWKERKQRPKQTEKQDGSKTDTLIPESRAWRASSDNLAPESRR